MNYSGDLFIVTKACVEPVTLLDNGMTYNCVTCFSNCTAEVLNERFLHLVTGCHTKAKNSCLPYYLPIPAMERKKRRIHAFPRGYARSHTRRFEIDSSILFPTIIIVRYARTHTHTHLLTHTSVCICLFMGDTI